MQAAFIAFVRLVYCMKPLDSDRITLRVARYIKTGYFLLLFSGLIMLFWIWPLQRHYAPLLTLPCCIYLVIVHMLFKGHIAIWAQQKNLPASETSSARPWTELFNATWTIATILTVSSYPILSAFFSWPNESQIRSLAGVVGAIIGQFYSIEWWYTLFADDALPLSKCLCTYVQICGIRLLTLCMLVCYWIFYERHPGWYLPREFTVLLYHEKADTKYQPIANQIQLGTI